LRIVLQEKPRTAINGFYADSEFTIDRRVDRRGHFRVSLASSWYQVQAEKDALRRDLERKAETFGESLAGMRSLTCRPETSPESNRWSRASATAIMCLGIGVYDLTFFPLVVTRDLSSILRGAPPVLSDALARNQLVLRSRPRAPDSRLSKISEPPISDSLARHRQSRLCDG
jgi:hypothetical protein